MVSWYGAEFDSVVRWFKAFASFRLRTVKGHSHFAEVRETPSGWLVTIDREQTPEAALDCLVHEISHLIDWDRNGYVEGDKEQHRRSFGVIYSDLYRRFHEEFGEGK